MNLLRLKIVTPEKIVFEDVELESITVPTSEGEITILPGHIPLMSKVMAGEIAVKKKGKSQFLYTADGFLKLEREGNLTILSDYAVRSEDMEEAKIKEAVKKAEQELKEKTSERDFAVAEAQLRKTLIELKVSQRRKSRQPKI